MKIKKVIELTGAPRQTIHYYIREGLLPKPQKTNRNQAEYHQEHIERLFLIKELQERFFLPLSVIKEIVMHMKDLNRTDSGLRVKAENFTPLAQFLPELVAGEKSFMEETGLSGERLAHFEQYGIITPTVVSEEKIYSQDDVSIGKLLGTMRRVGFSVEKGFPEDALRSIKERFEKIIHQFNQMFLEVGTRIMPTEELEAIKKPTTELMAVFFYHLYRRMASQDLNRRLMKAKKSTG